jgi:hypothetical protein
MGYVPYVGFTTYRRATVMTCLYFKRLMFMQIFCKYIYIKRKKKKVVTPSLQELLSLTPRDIWLLVKSVRGSITRLWIVTIGWIMPIKANILHHNFKL